MFCPDPYAPLGNVSGIHGEGGSVTPFRAGDALETDIALPPAISSSGSGGPLLWMEFVSFPPHAGIMAFVIVNEVQLLSMLAGYKSVRFCQAVVPSTEVY